MNHINADRAATALFDTTIDRFPPMALLTLPTCPGMAVGYFWAYPSETTLPSESVVVVWFVSALFCLLLNRTDRSVPAHAAHNPESQDMLPISYSELSHNT